MLSKSVLGVTCLCLSSCLPLFCFCLLVCLFVCLFVCLRAWLVGCLLAFVCVAGSVCLLGQLFVCFLLLLACFFFVVDCFFWCFVSLSLSIDLPLFLARCRRCRGVLIKF